MNILGQFFFGLFVLFVIDSSIGIDNRTHSPLLFESEDNKAELLRYNFSRKRDPATNQIPPGIQERERAYTATLPSTLGENSPLRVGNPDELSIKLDNLEQHGIERTGGRSRAFAIDITNSNVLVAGAVGGGIWRSTDAGATWSKRTKNTDGHSVTCLIQDKRLGKQHIWYYGTGEVFSTGGYPLYSFDIGEGIFKSIDSGKSWNKLKSTSVFRRSAPSSPFHFITEIAIDNSISSQDILYAACSGSIQRSTDGGETWRTVLGNSSPSSAQFSQVIVTPTGVVYASIGDRSGTTSGLYRSPDGVVFTRLSTSGFSSLGRAVLAFAPSDPNNIWIFAYAFGGTQLLKYTYIGGNGTGAGGLWHRIPTSQLSSILNPQGGFNMTLAVHPEADSILVVGATSLYYTEDNGKTLEHIGGYSKLFVSTRTWDPIKPSLFLWDSHHPDCHAVVFDPEDPQYLYSACDGGIFRASNVGDGIRWESLNAGFNVGQFYSVDIDKVGTDPKAFVGGAQDNNACVGVAGSGKPMQWVLGGDGMICAMANGGTIYYPSYQGGKVYRVDMNATRDSVLNFTAIYPPSSSGVNFGFIAPLAVDPSNDNVLYLLSNSALWRNSNVRAIPLNRSTNSTSLNWKVTSIGNIGGQLSAIGLSKSHNSVVYLGTTSSAIIRLDSISHSNPIQRSIRSSLFPLNAFCSCIYVDPTNPDIIIVAFSNYNVKSLFYSDDAGATFVEIGGNLESPVGQPDSGPSVLWVESQRTTNGTIYYSGTTSGLFYTTALDGANTMWTRIDEVGAVAVEMIKTRDVDGFVAVATHGLGIFTFNASLNEKGEPGDVIASPTSKSIFGLPYPNPSNSTCNVPIKGTIPKNIKFEIVNTVGHQMFLLDDSRISNGVLQIDAHQLRPGTYFIRPRSGSNLAFRDIPFTVLR